MCVDQGKLARVLKYLQFRDYKSKLLKNLEEEDVQQEPGKQNHPSFLTLLALIFTFDSLSLFAVRGSGCWGESAPAATGPGLPGVDGPNWRIPFIG